MLKLNRAHLSSWYDELSRSATIFPMNRRAYAAVTILVVTFLTPLLLIAAPALIMFDLAKKQPQHAEAYEAVGVYWLLFLLVAALVFLITATVVSIKRAAQRKKLAQDYEKQLHERQKF
jgi:large-conductance mechanosensitive channel